MFVTQLTTATLSVQEVYSQAWNGLIRSVADHGVSFRILDDSAEINWSASSEHSRISEGSLSLEAITGLSDELLRGLVLAVREQVGELRSAGAPFTRRAGGDQGDRDDACGDDDGLLHGGRLPPGHECVGPWGRNPRVSTDPDQRPLGAARSARTADFEMTRSVSRRSSRRVRQCRRSRGRALQPCGE
jgi:hypothetical protein